MIHKLIQTPFIFYLYFAFGVLCSILGGFAFVQEGENSISILGYGVICLVWGSLQLVSLVTIKKEYHQGGTIWSGGSSTTQRLQRKVTALQHEVRLREGMEEQLQEQLTANHNKLRQEGVEHERELSFLKDGTEKFLRSLGAEIKKQLDSIQQEHSQVQTILGNAIQKLLGSFHKVTDHTRVQQKVIVSLTQEEHRVSQDQDLGFNSFLAEVNSSLSSFQSMAKEQVEVARKMVKKIGTISQSLMEVEGSLDKINEIAEQINMLSINARIEAAKVGDRGRGFAVVANEIQDLHQTSTQFRDTIESSMQAIMNSVNETRSEASHLVENTQKITSESKRHIHSILPKISLLQEKIDSSVSQISHITQQVGREINQAVVSIQFQDITQQVLDHSNDRIHNLGKLIQNISQKIAETDRSSQMRGVLKEMEELVQEVEGNWTEKEQDTAGGDVELF